MEKISAALIYEIFPLLGQASAYPAPYGLSINIKRLSEPFLAIQNEIKDLYEAYAEKDAEGKPIFGVLPDNSVQYRVPADGAKKTEMDEAYRQIMSQEFDVDFYKIPREKFNQPGILIPGNLLIALENIIIVDQI